ncbi:zinc dependent phospholipase C family protein [Dyadobacter sediminis]|uniref:Integrase n=2 Tax=Dyadobacter sediminis TaxID=1493691 RepID=A0A5R9KFJ6_9BACT|nr:zinc dependent phospholipase C family protein [Dyadobacter sediminis]TLU94912.1 integrase [Dyadobacter sediminis]
MAQLCVFRKKKSDHFRSFSKFISCMQLFMLVASIVQAADVKWGFWAHKRINRMAVFRLPVEMQYFYKKNIDYLTENATNPDRRRYSVVGEAERHYIDLDVYGDSARLTLPKYWKDAVQKIGEDSLRKHGIVPWYIQSAAFQLTEAFKAHDPARILRVSADLGHYIADAHVPLHTTRNYNGQLSNQEGIHAFWESRLPELFAEDYDMWIGEPVYHTDIAEQVWKTVMASNTASDSVFKFEKQLTVDFESYKKYSYELRNNVLTRSYSKEFSEKYHQMLGGQVERRMKASVKMVGDIWYSCWINAGQPDLKKMAGFVPDQKVKNEESAEQQSWFQRILRVRSEGDE